MTVPLEEYDHEPVEEENEEIMPTTSICAEIDWPAEHLWMTHRARPTGPAGSYSWWGSLIHNKRDLTGQLYMRNRYYDPAAARFTQEDPIGLAGGINLYGFAAGDPVSYSYPYGLSAQACCIRTMLALSRAVSLAPRVLSAIVVGPDDPNAPNGSLASPGLMDPIAATAGAVAGRFTAVRAAVRGAAASESATLAASRASGLGDLTVDEVRAIQTVVEEAGRPLNVVGSAARGARRTGSDIDYLSGPSSLKHFDGLEDNLPGIDPSHGIVPGTPNPHMGPSIRFEPGAAPRFIPGQQ